MRLSRLRTIFCLLLCLAIAIGAGFFFRGKFPHVSQEELEDPHETYLSPIGAILSFEENQGEDSDTFTNGTIVLIRALEKHQYGEAVVTSAEVVKAYSGRVQEGSNIQIKESYSYSYGINYSEGLYVPMQIGSTYLADLTEYGNLYRISGDEFGIIPEIITTTQTLKEDTQAMVSPSAVITVSEDFQAGDSFADTLSGYMHARSVMLQRAEQILSAS